ncbi:caspase family protein [Bradyrhizobium liaoningense]|uniref:caspase family protein n=1 Tax=Bradyrhizobium liaoningense TaxID=43992 RepID=UPI001BA4B437|nr:caspase family protein [Bradyrhizobium liaoningense]MBR0858614.1 caspase family protein [Bradyrhizobium liaoningense]
MKKRALLVGSQTGGLSGVHTDIDVIQKILKPFGFATCDVLTEKDATRERILAAYERLIADHRADDAAVIYYSGHGGRAANPAWTSGVKTPQFLQFIVPTDFDAGDGEFHGIFAFELSALMGRLTAAGRNVTVLLDCCHAAMMSRDYAKLTPRALPRVCSDGVAERLDSVKVLWQTAVESNPHAVRLVAADYDRSAFESARADGKPGGLMTAALEQALGESGGMGTQVNWAAVGSRVRELVMRSVPEQRPEIEGPSRRRLFQLEEAGDFDGVAFFRENGRAALRAGRLLGAVKGAEYLLMPPAVTALEPRKSVAKAVVETVDGDRSYVSLDPPDAPVVDGALAFPSGFPFGRRAVALEGAVAAAVIAHNKFVKAADVPGQAIATLRASEGKLVVLGPDGAALTLVLNDDDDGRAAVNAVLVGLARSDAVRTLPKGDLPGALDVAWGRVGGEEPIAMQNGDVLHAGESLFVEITNRAATTVYAAVFDLGIGGDVTLLTTSIPTGIPIAPNARYRLGEREGRLIGLKSSWNDRVPSDGPRREAIVVIAAEAPTQFRALEGKVRIHRGKGQASALEELLSQIGSATTRDFESDQAGGGRFLTHHIELEFSPSPRPTEGRRARFILDQSLAPAFLSRAAVTADAPPAGEIALRLTKLVVHSNRAYWGATGVRIDALVLTAPQKGHVPYAPATFEFPRVRNEDALSFDNLLLFEGKPARYLDFQLWVSKAKPGTKPLGELIRGALNDKEFQSAATVLAGLAVAAPAAATVVGAAAAAGTIGFFAEKVLTAAVDASIGLYRTSFLPSEQFGLGTHPQVGAIRAQDFSFSFEIVRF